MPEQEPQYFKEFRKHIDKRFDEQDKYIIKTVTTIVDDAVEELAIMTLKNFNRVDVRLASIVDRLDGIDIRLDKIEGTMSRHDVRIQKVERAAFA